MRASVVGLLVCTTGVFASIDLRTASFQKFTALGKRQTVYCAPVSPGPNLCARSCGKGYVTCAEDPHCFDPSKGQICCSNGYYCDAGEYCTTDGCCKQGQSLAQCAAASISSGASLSRLPTRTGFSAVPSSSAPPSSSGIAALPTLGGEAIGAALAGLGMLLF